MRRGQANRVLEARITRVLRLLPAAGRCEIAAVHDLRVATRRLREAIPVVATGMRGRTLRRAARRIGRALGPLREMDVTLATLEEFRVLEGTTRTSVDRAATAFKGDRRRLLVGLVRRLRGDDLKALADGALRESAPLSRSTVRAFLVDAVGQAARRAAALRRRLEHATGMYLPDRLHEVRLSVKKLRYTIELVLELREARQGRQGAPRGRSADARALRTLRRAQGLLGRIHDLEVLIARIRALQGTSAVTGLRLSADLDRLVRRLEEECRALHARHMAGRDDLLMVCDHAESAPKKYTRPRRVV